MIKPIEPGDVTYPLCGWQLGPLPEHGVLLFQPHYLEREEDPIEAAIGGPIYAIPLVHVPKLIDALQRVIEKKPPPSLKIV